MLFSKYLVTLTSCVSLGCRWLTLDLLYHLEYVRPTYRTAYKLPLGSSVLHLGQPQPQPFNPLIPNELRRRRAVRPLNIKIPSKNLGRQRCAEGFNFVAKRLTHSLP